MAESSGELLSAILAGSWRQRPAPFERTASELSESLPLLLKSGAAALCWWRVKHSDLRNLPAAAELHQIYRRNTLQAGLHQLKIEQALALLRAAGIEHILVKGWAAAAAYPEQGLRPCGDVDLCVPKEQYRAAELALKDSTLSWYEVDLHCGFEKFGGGSFEKIYERSQALRVGDLRLRVPGAEDHLRILSIHMLREGAWRPLWLCDVAAALESRPASFDWDYCFGGNRRWANWVTSALRLAHQLLGAKIDDTPAADNPKPLPRWLAPAILKEWESLEPAMTSRHHAPMASYRYQPSRIWEGFRHRWPNPIEATVSMKGSFNRLPRLPFQVGSLLTRGAKFAVRLPRLLREP